MISQTPNLAALQWNHRVVLLFAERAEDASFLKQKSLFEADPAGMAERDIKVFAIVGHADDANALRTQFDVHSDRFTLVLVGKDGGRKMKREAPVDLSALYGKIDAMPMRRNEMKQSGISRNGGAQ